MKRRTCLFFCCCFLAVTAVVHAVEVPNFRYIKPIKTSGEVSNTAITAFVLDNHTYENTRDNFGDMRIFASDNTEIPFLLETKKQTRTRQIKESCDTEVISFNELDGNRFEIIVELKDHAGTSADITALDISTPLENFEKTVNVSGSHNNKDWEPVVNAASIFDYSQFVDVRNTRIKLDGANFKYYKIQVDNVTDIQESAIMEINRKIKDGEIDTEEQGKVIQRRDFRIDELKFIRTRVQEKGVRDQMRTYEVQIKEKKNLPDKQETRIFLKTRRQPLTEFTLEIPEQNFHRRVVIEVPGVDSKWRSIDSETIQKLKLQSYSRKDTTLSFSTNRSSEYRIRILNKDNPPLQVTDADAKGKIYQAVFFAGKYHSPECYYASDTVSERGTYDIADIISSLRARSADNIAVELQLGNHQKNPVYKQKKPEKQTRSKAPLITALVILVLVLGGVLFYAAKRVDTSGDSPDF